MPNKRRTRTKHKMPLWRKVILLFFLAAVTGLLIGGGVFAYYASKAPEMRESDLVDPVASQILDKDGEVIATIGKKKREIIEYEEIPSLVEDAVIATEDARFYEHHGVDPIRLGGAVISNLTDGFGSEGASTITQQVVKRSFLSPEKTLERKAQEAWMAYQFDKDYSKEEILEMYLNKVYYSDNIYGISTAADYYFGKDIEELELAEAALLAGMPQSPNNYNPYEHPDRAEERRNIVLELMEEHEKITTEEKEKAQNTPINEGLIERDDNERTKLTEEDGNEAFVDVVIDELKEHGDYNIYEDGLKIHTTLDTDAQSTMEEMLNSDDIIDFPANKNDQPFQAGITLLDTDTGAVRAIGGGRNYGKEQQRGFNFATDTSRQPGSIIKPLLVYGPAIEKLEWSTARIIEDEEMEYEAGGKPKNWDGEFKGDITIREALWDSRNIPAIKTFNEVGHDYGTEFLENLGINVEETLYESAAIGGINKGTSPMTMAGAYASFGNGGTYNEPHTITMIEQRDGSTIEINPESHEAMKESTAYMVTDMLKDVIEHPEGTGSYAEISDIPAAGKTGTTNYPEEYKNKHNIDSDGAPDSWFAGYTTEYTTAIWTGYQNRENYLTSEERRTAQRMFRYLMDHISKDPSDFKQPDNVKEVEIEEGSNPPKLASDFTPEEEITKELFIEGTEPTSESKEYIPDLPSPTNLKGSYNSENNAVRLEWDYYQQEEDDRTVDFEISSSVDGEETGQTTSTKEEALSVNGLDPDKEYTFTVTAVSDGEESDPASVKINTTETTDKDNSGEQQSGNGSSNESSDSEDEEQSNERSSNQEGDNREDNETTNGTNQNNPNDSSSNGNEEGDSQNSDGNDEQENAAGQNSSNNNNENEHDENDNSQQEESNDTSSGDEQNEPDGSSDNTEQEDAAETSSNNNVEDTGQEENNANTEQDGSDEDASSNNNDEDTGHEEDNANTEQDGSDGDASSNNNDEDTGQEEDNADTEQDGSGNDTSSGSNEESGQDDTSKQTDSGNESSADGENNEN
ncbi:penicillin-binding protein 1A [Sediminibacillus massiliensis]|uniref:penicillin-binding protein 1A n=1 Tax=Sediminibacillus massiliensis TaxID=1926277 RepID=UPI0009888863|nr:penicillin-binding protein 1A [Sediminibacillus massiliensis]